MRTSKAVDHFHGLASILKICLCVILVVSLCPPFTNAFADESFEGDIPASTSEAGEGIGGEVVDPTGDGGSTGNGEGIDDATPGGSSSSSAAGEGESSSSSAASQSTSASETTEATDDSGEETPETADPANAPAATENTVELVYEDNSLVATVTAPESALPAGASLEVEEIHPVDVEKADAYGEALSKLSETLYAQEKVYTAAKIYDIRIMSVDGFEIEPNGAVKVALEYKKAQPMGGAHDQVEIAHVTAAGELEMVEAEVDTTKSGEVKTAEFTATSFSYYLVFSQNGDVAGGTTEASVGDNVGWLQMSTPPDGTWTDARGIVHTYQRYGIGTSVDALISDAGRSPEEINQVGSNISRRIVQIRLLNEDGSEYSPGKTTYFWTWEQTIRVESFNLPDLEVVKTVSTVANLDGELELDSLVGSYDVRGWTSGDGNGDVNTLDIYVKPTTHTANAMRYIIRYVHADGSVSDGNVRYLERGSTGAINVDRPRDGEVFSGIAVVSGAEAVNANSNAKTVTINFDQNVDIAKAYVYFETAPIENTTGNRGRYDKDAEGNYYNGALGLYTDKTAKAVDGTDREFLVELEAWYVDNPASVGMVLDASGSMAWTAGIPTALELTQAQYNQLRRYNSASNPIPLNLLNTVLDPTAVDNSNNGYNGYKYYVKTLTATTNNPIDEYVALGYKDSRATTTVRYNNTDYTRATLGNNGTTEGYALITNAGPSNNGEGWYYVNSHTTPGPFNDFGAKRFEGIPWNHMQALGLGNSTSAARFWVAQENGKYVLRCLFNCGNAASPDGYTGWDGTTVRSGTQTSTVYVKRDQMMTKAETLQDSIAQFGAILNGASPDSETAIVRFSHRSFNDLQMLNWTSSSEDIAAAMDLIPNGRGGQTKADGTYQYGITGGTVSYRGFQEFKDTYQASADANNYKYLILFTDGKDQGPNHNDNGAVVNNEISSWYATGYGGTKMNLDTAFPGYTIITMFMKSAGMSESDINDSKAFLEGLASKDAAGNKLYFEADSNNSYDVVERFREIANHIVTGLQDYTVRDYIDPRFDVINNNGMVISVLDENGEFTGNDNMQVVDGLYGFTTPDGKYAKLGYDSSRKMFYVLWQDQDIQASAVNGTTVSPWKSQIRLQAKEDFIGGNDVLTNGNEPGENLVYKPDPNNPLRVTTAPKTDKSGNPMYDWQGRPIPWDVQDFPYAAVNPGLLDVALGNYEDTVFLGEEITPGELLSDMVRAGKAEDRITSDPTELRHVADSVYNATVLAAAGDDDQSSIWYVEYLERLGKKLHGDAEFYFTLLKHVNLTGTGGVQPLIEAMQQASGTYTVTEAVGSVTIEGKAGTAAAGEKITILKNEKIELELPYYYLESPSDPSSYAGPTTSGTDPNEDKVGTITYTWEVKEFAGNIPAEDSKDEGNEFVKFDTYVDASNHMSTAGSKKDVDKSVKYQFSISYVPAALTADAKADGSGRPDSQGDGSERTRALTGINNRVNALIRNVDTATERQAVDGEQNTTDEMGWAIVHAVDGRILIEKKMKTEDFELAQSLGLTGTMTFTLTGLGIALDAQGNPKDEAVWTKSLSLAGATVAKVDGEYTYLVLADNWAEGLPLGDYVLDETVDGALQKVAIAAEPVVFDTDAATDPAGPYDGTVNNWAAKSEGAVTYHIGQVNGGVPGATSYTDTDYTYAMVSSEEGTYKNVDPKLAAGNGKAHLNAQLGHLVVENEIAPTSINVSKFWEDDDAVPTEPITIKLTGSDGAEYFVLLEPNGGQTWSGTTGPVVPLNNVAYTAEEGEGTWVGGECTAFTPFGDSFTLDTADGEKVFFATGVTYSDEADASGNASTDSVIANTSPLAGSVAFTNAKLKTSLEITKVDSRDGETPIEGVAFQLATAGGTVVDTKTTDADGKVRFVNVQPNTSYVLTETAAPEGWTLRDPIEITVSAAGTISITGEYDATDPMTPTLGEPDANLMYPLTVPNARTYLLPAAGGLGIFEFLFLGALIMVLAAGIPLIRRKYPIGMAHAATRHPARR